MLPPLFVAMTSAAALAPIHVISTTALGMHETVSLDRFRSAWVKFLVPFRMRVEAA